VSGLAERLTALAVDIGVSSITVSDLAFAVGELSAEPGLRLAGRRYRAPWASSTCESGGSHASPSPASRRSTGR
jgi:hypothetical protein